MDRTGLAQKLIVEFIGPFALCFAGPGAIVMTGGGDLVAIALAHGLAIGLLVMAAGHISGGHFNPAVTVAMIATRRIDVATGVAYIVAQLLGGLCGALGVRLVTDETLRNAVQLGVPSVGVGHSNTNALVMEAILTFFLVFVIFGAAIDPRSSKSVAGLVIGLTITMDILAGGPVSGAAMNPARWFGPAVVQTQFDDFWIWIVAPIAGALVAAFVYNDVILRSVRGDDSAGVPRAVGEVQVVAPSSPSGAATARRRDRRRR